MYKKLSFLLMLLVLGTASFTSCKKDDPEDPNEKPNIVLGLWAKVDSTDWASESGIAAKVLGVINIENSMDSTAFYITLDDNITPGTYSLTGSGRPSIKYNSSPTTTWTAQDGELIITRHDSSTVEGTFHFNAYRNNDTLRVTEGRFASQY